MAVTSQSTLKELVDETGIIKNELISCRKNLKTNLSNKGVAVSGTDKMQGLVEKVKNITVSKHLEWANKDVWVQAKYCMSPRFKATMSAVKGRAYFIGGEWNETSPRDTVSCYDSYTNTWSERTIMSEADSSFTSQAVGDDIYVIGGSKSMRKTRKYSTTGDYWTDVAPSPTDSLYSTSAVIDNKIYVLSSYAYNSRYKNECFDASTGTWTTKASTPSTNWYVGICCAIDSRIYFTIGTSIYKYYSTINSWSYVTSSDYEFAYDKTCMIAYDSYIYFFSPSNSRRYNVDTGAWESINMENAFSDYDLSYFSLCKLNENIVLKVGGKSREKNPDGKCSYYILGR